MPCRDFRDDQTYSSGYSAAKEEAKQELNKLNNSLLNAQKQVLMLESYLCTFICQTALQEGDSPEDVINHFVAVCPNQMEGIRDWWLKHAKRDTDRIKKRLEGMDEFDKLQLLEILQEQLNDN